MRLRSSRLSVATVFCASPLVAQTPGEFATERGLPQPVVVRAASLRLPTVLTAPAEKAEPTAKSNVHPIDLPTALRLANASNPTIAMAQIRVRESLARVNLADALILPNISVGGTYFWHDGIDQNRRADMFVINRNNVFAGGGAGLRVDLAEAIYQPLVARRMADAETAIARATNNNTQLDVASAYFDLVHTHALQAVNADIIEKSEAILKAAVAGEKAGLVRTAADVNRARTEVALRRMEREDIAGRQATASARLARLLLLEPAVTLLPLDEAAVPIELIPTDSPVEALIAQAVRSRPEMEAAYQQREAAATRARQARYGPLLPRVQAEYLGGGFGGGKDGVTSNLEGRSDLSAQVFWELRGLGFGNLADVRLRDAERDRATLVTVAAHAQVAAEVVESLRVATARKASLDEANTAVKEAREMYRKFSETSFGMVGPRGQFDALEPLTAVQALNQARMQLLAATIEYNRAQVRLLTAVGTPIQQHNDATKP